MRADPEDPEWHVDAEGFEAYEAQDGEEVVLYQRVAGSARQVFDAWLKEVWLAGGSQVHEGVGRGLVGHVRRVPLGVEEEILSAGLPPEDEVEAAVEAALEASRGGVGRNPKIPSVSYRVRAFGPFPLQRHTAIVRFVDETSSSSSSQLLEASSEKPLKTLVVWSIKMELSAMGRRLHCGGLVRWIFRTALRRFLHALAASAAATRPQT